MELGLKMGMCGYDRMRGMQNRMKGGPMDMDTNRELVSEAASVARPGDDDWTQTISVSSDRHQHHHQPCFHSRRTLPCFPDIREHARTPELDLDSRIHSAYMSRPASRVASTYGRGGDYGFGE